MEDFTGYIVQVQKLNKQIDALAKALKFYADEKNWQDTPVYHPRHPEVFEGYVCVMDSDKGKVARQALSPSPDAGKKGK